MTSSIEDSFTIYLDCIQDPGNLGTIIRICDWFGVRNLFCSPDTADLYNPKTIQATMGSFSRVQLHYANFDKIEKTVRNSGFKIYGALLDGESIYEKELPEKSLLIIGNEGNGINEQLQNKIDKKIRIPSFSLSRYNAESLNAAVATGILCSEFKRRSI